jgi:SAM-dependent methyltransferase
VANAHGNVYDTFAQAYARDNESNAFNAYYERPAVLSLLGDVAGLRLLDAGCGAGAHAALLVERGATVTGVDQSPAMIDIASGRLSGNARFLRADLGEPLPFEDGSFDAVLASLVMHYLRDWGPTLRELHRVLVRDGRLVVSTHHPFMDHQLAGGDNYFATYAFSEEWRKGDHTVEMRFWHRPLHAMVRALRDAGFAIEVIDEPAPEAAVRDLDPDAWRSLTTEPRFIFFAARAVSHLSA